MAESKLYTLFVDLEKAFDGHPRKVTLWELRRKNGVMEREVFAITEMYKNIKTSVKILYKQSKEFEVKVGVHQDLVLSPLVAVVMDYLKRCEKKWYKRTSVC